MELTFGQSHLRERLRLRNLLGVADHEVKGAGSNLSKATVAIQRDGNADRGIRSRELETTFQQSVIDFVDVKCCPSSRSNMSHCLRNGAIYKAVANGFDITSDHRNRLSSDVTWRDGRARHLEMGHRLVSDFNRILRSRLSGRLAHGSFQFGVRGKSRENSVDKLLAARTEDKSR